MGFVGNHLTLLETNAAIYASSSAFKIPLLNACTGQVQEWHSVTYLEFKADVELFAKYWANVLKPIPQRSVIGLWLGGKTYLDLLHIYGVSRAGYIPQLCGIRLSNHEVIFELLQKGNAKALIYDTSCAPLFNQSPIPIYLAVNAKDNGSIDEGLPAMPILRGDDTAFIFHTSGSTSGSPKLVSWSYSWLDININKIVQTALNPESIVNVWMGTMCAGGPNLALLRTIRIGGCTVQPTTFPFSSEELINMIKRCGLNTLVQYTAYLATHLRRSRQDPELLSLLRGLRDVIYGGSPLSLEDEAWAHQNDIKLRNLFANTECGPLLISIHGQDMASRLLRPITGARCDFRPVIPTTESNSGNELTGTPRLLELVIPAESGDCPGPPHHHADGNFHTGDLFEEVIPGHYASRGREDDWIKCENSRKCDTRAIEDNVRATCGPHILDCIVVGYGRPSPTLFVEASLSTNHDNLKTDILRATLPFNSRRYFHERISSEKMIVIVPPNTLPRTAAKGNIRRKAVEEAYKSQLDAIYSST